MEKPHHALNISTQVDNKCKQLYPASIAVRLELWTNLSLAYKPVKQQPARNEMLKRSWYLSSNTNFFFLKCIWSMPSKLRVTLFCFFDADGSGQWSQSHKICESGFSWKAVTVQEPNGLPFLAPKQTKTYCMTQQVSGVQLQLHCFLFKTFCLSKGKINQA